MSRPTSQPAMRSGRGAWGREPLPFFSRRSSHAGAGPARQLLIASARGFGMGGSVAKSAAAWIGLGPTAGALQELVTSSRLERAC